MSKGKSNLSKTYLLPLIAQEVGIESQFIDNIENTYLFDEKGEFINCILIRHEFSFKNPEFTAYEHRLINNKLFVKLIDIGDEVIYVFKFPEEYLPEYDHFIEGEYSKFGEDAKKLILHFWTIMYGKTASGINAILKMRQILYKDKKLKQQIEEELSSEQCKIVLSDDAELGNLMLIEDETLNIEMEVNGGESGNANERDIR